MKGLISTKTPRGNYGTPQSYRGQSPHRPRKGKVKK
jgi:hypothetical protein